MGIRSLKSSSVASGTKRNKFWDQAASLVTYISRSLNTVVTTGYSNPYGDWGYFQSNNGTGLPAADVTLLCGSYNSNYTTNGNSYTIGRGGTGYTQRTTYPTTIFQTSMACLNSKAFVLGGNGLNGTAGGGTTANVYYMGTSLNSWTAGTSLPSAGNCNAGYSPYNIIIRPDAGNVYRGSGTGSWTQITATPTDSSTPFPIGNRTYVTTLTATYYSTDEGSSWVNANITPPLSTRPMVVGPSPDNTPTSIYLFYNTEYTQTPAAYYFNGNAYTSTNNFGTQRTDGTGPNIYTYAINGNQISFMMTNAGYRYMTIN